MIKMERKIISLILILSFSLLVVGCSQEQVEFDKVTLGAETSLLTAAVWVAEDQGYFQEQGLDLTIKEFDSGKASFNDMLNGGVDISTVAPTPIMFNSFKRQDFSIFATFVDSNEDVKVITRKDVGINSAADLKGKKIGIVDGSTSQFFLGAFLIYNQIFKSDVETVSFTPSELPSALQNGDVDAIVIWEPHAYNAINLLGDNSLVIPSSEVYTETFNLMVLNKFVEDNPEIIEKFLMAVDEATNFIKNNKEESQTIVAERLNLDQEIITTLWDDFKFKISLDQSLLVTLEDEARWAIENDLTDAKEVPNYLDYIHLNTLEKVKPEAIGIIR
jgi:ABC-type nitrate/sulfonate/bicarbonate transport system substrate-binding protein